ncbi:MULTISPECIES: carbohydrate ABC transporter permease [Paenibacillus]|nr:carbohydrate ABC transporter permease [Paenibacillus foliorum]
MNKTSKWEYVVHYVILNSIAIFALFPFYWMFVTSVKPAEQILQIPPAWWPSYFEFKNYTEVFQIMPLFEYLKNSIIYSLSTTIVCVLLACFAGYSLSRFRFKIRNASIVLILSSQLIPWVMSIIPFYFIMQSLKLNNTTIGITLAYSIWAIPFCTLMLKNYFTSTLPVEIEESAMIDGCSRMKILFVIALPISIPGIVATAIFSFILAWNEYMWASIVLSDTKYKPLSVGIHDFIGQFGVTPSVSLFMAASVITTLPILLIFGFLQKYLISGMSDGAIKG